MVIYKPLWAQEKVRRTGLQLLARLKIGEPCVGMETQMINAKKFHHTSQKGEEHQEEGSFLGYGNPYTFQDDVALVALLKTCAKEKDLLQGSRLHADILKRGLLARSIFVGSTLVNMYAKCGALAKAQDLLDELPMRDVVSWNALVAGYAQHEHGEHALNCFEKMQHEGVFPDPVTFACVLKACGSIGAPEKGKRIHAEIVRHGLLGKHVILGNALVDMYAKCGALKKGQQVFDELPVRNVVSWTALIAGYCQHEYVQEALICFDRMQDEGLSPNAVTFACVLKACASIRAADKGKQIHSEIVTKGLLKTDIVLGNALMVMYAKCGALVQAREVFDGLLVRNVASWTGLITGYCQHGHGEEAIICFEQMKREGLSPNVMTFACILKACGSIGAVEKGEEMHIEIARKGLLGNCTVLGNALVDMYAKCGVLSKAQEVFDKLFVHDVVSWTALIAGYCEQGQGVEAVSCFEGMKEKGFSPDAVTFSCILKVCGNMGAAEKGQMYFESMSMRYGITPTLEHQISMVVLFGHEGHFDKVMVLIKKMPCFDCLSALINACQKWGNTELGRLAFEYAVQLNKKLTVPEVFMSQIMESKISQKWFAS